MIIIKKAKKDIRQDSFIKWDVDKLREEFEIHTEENWANVLANDTLKVFPKHVNN